ncbi:MULTISPECIES: HAMP domain-containing sensor histidine kinase [Neisseria]|uniref:HAMP domain-containing sensor histidine kinase n=1 Tax=Neisseria TaxID=482 RepID=UPI000A198731|nr:MULTISPECIES: HAMP domain-containing sensor histidine kinase [Neisseria]MDO1510617.1 HAMP domain-containing sensor histidine kinase [Neisseria sp. MVDL19-042950]MDO1516259.1 HAMP domain-containing sensor histidine kinase [Neisseria sp. MVDL18-041461]MDO1564269.1 HAMP domain-containing sensor histidine kinase [Neisseria sp. MVDL20-010259]OSI07745.1 two-component sensor histidine kinase [Neisseria animaloris]VEH88378.1 two-component system sensor kinase [Neisseria animaloris]
MKLFQRIFATFCAVIICAIFVASFSFWLVQNTIAENQFQQQRTIETTLMSSMISAFKVRGEQGAREILSEWKENPVSQNVFVVTGDDSLDILNRPVDGKMIEGARRYAFEHPSSDLAHVEYDRWGEEYLFFIRGWDNQQIQRLPSPLFIPGLQLAPIWHEFIILSFIILVGLLLAYILTNNITKPIRILGFGMNRLAVGDLETRISQQMDDRDDELSQLAVQFDKMAQQLQKLVAKERHLLHHVSHEMRSPLARMQAIVGLIQAQPQKQEQYLKRLESELTRMDTLVGELLTLSRLETSNVPLEKENLALVSFLTQLVEDSQSVALQNNQKVTLSIEKVPDTAQLLANESYLYRAFDNVVRNAMAYSPEGSDIKLRLYQDAKNWLIDVVDNGPGVDEMQLPHIFTAFYRADSSAQKPGTGLGLALTKHIVEQHGGKIIAENVKPNGLKMRFILPKKKK